MPRNGSGVFSLPGTYLAVSGETIQAQQHNDPLTDLESDANTARPIVAGGTGATTAAGARTELDVPGLSADNTFSGTNTFSAATSHSSYVEIAEQSAPSTPSSGNGRIYFDTLGLARSINDGGTDIPLGRLIQRVEATPFTSWSSTAAIAAAADTKMQNTEGVQVLSVSITPKKTTNRLRIRALIHCSASTSTALTLGVFNDSIAAALSQSIVSTTADVISPVVVEHEMAAGTTTSTTFTIRSGVASGSIAFNGNSGGRRGGGNLACRLTVEEYE